MNKKTFITVALLSMGCCTFTARAQNLDKAAESYRQFNSLRAAGTDEPGIYAALYQCYKDYVEVLSAATANTPAYSQAKDALREIWPFLQTGAAYNSNHGSQQNALLFAQAANETSDFHCVHLDPLLVTNDSIRGGQHAIHAP